MDKKLQEQIEEFKSYRVEKSPQEIILHYQKELRAIEDSMYVLSGKWKMQIIALLCNGKFRYSELEKGIAKITPKMLTKELKELEQNGLILRLEEEEPSIKVSYKIAEYGYTLVPIIVELTKWGAAHRTKIMGTKSE